MQIEPTIQGTIPDEEGQIQCDIGSIIIVQQRELAYGFAEEIEGETSSIELDSLDGSIHQRSGGLAWVCVVSGLAEGGRWQPD